MSDVSKKSISDVNTHIWVFSGPHGVTHTTSGTHVSPMPGHLNVSHIAMQMFSIFLIQIWVEEFKVLYNYIIQIKGKKYLLKPKLH